MLQYKNNTIQTFSAPYVRWCQFLYVTIQKQHHENIFSSICEVMPIPLCYNTKATPWKHFQLHMWCGANSSMLQYKNKTIKNIFSSICEVVPIPLCYNTKTTPLKHSQLHMWSGANSFMLQYKNNTIKHFQLHMWGGTNSSMLQYKNNTIKTFSAPYVRWCQKHSLTN